MYCPAARWRCAHAMNRLEPFDRCRRRRDEARDLSGRHRGEERRRVAESQLAKHHRRTGERRQPVPPGGVRRSRAALACATGDAVSASSWYGIFSIRRLPPSPRRCCRHSRCPARRHEPPPNGRRGTDAPPWRPGVEGIVGPQREKSFALTEEQLIGQARQRQPISRLKWFVFNHLQSTMSDNEGLNKTRRCVTNEHVLMRYS